MKIGIGVDPELFVADRKAMRLVSAHDLVPGTKDKPFPLEDGAVQVDGVAIEYNTKPAYTEEEFVSYNEKVLAQIRKMVPAHFEFIYKPTVFFDPLYFETIPDSPKELGCSPDYNAWTGGKVNPRPTPPVGCETMRTGSGHIHVSWTEGADPTDPSHIWDCCEMVKAYDTIVAPYLRLLDKDNNRANLYGKPGAFRPKSYGVEWRVPSNAWLNHKELWGWLFHSLTVVTKAVAEGKFFAGMNNTQHQFTTRELEKGTYRSPSLFLPELRGLPSSLTCEAGNGVPKCIKKGVRVAASSGRVSYDLDLDIKTDGTREYTTPSRLSTSEIIIL